MSGKLLIIGGGIAGLTAAIALLRRGFDVHVYERASELRAAGAGLGVGSNAFRAMSSIGLADQLLAKGKVLTAANILTDQGRLLTRTDSVKVSQVFGTDNITIHRAELLQLLKGEIPDHCVSTNKACVDFSVHEHGVSVTFEDGTVAEGDALIAADGIHSPIRGRLLPASAPRYAGYTCWRSVISGVPAGHDGSSFSETWGTAGRFGIVPLQGDRIYWYACINAAPNDPRYASYRAKDLKYHFEGYHAPIPEILERTDDDALLQNDIYDIKPLDRFAFGRVLLVGDAAHATTPNLGQGAGQAMEDAVILANCLARVGSVESAFQLFETKRLARTRKVVNTSWTLGRVAQLDSKWLVMARNTLFRLMPASFSERQMRFLFDVDFE